MKVHLTAIPEVHPKLLKDTLEFLSKIGGPIEYKDLGILELAPFSKTFKEFENIEELNEISFNTAILLGQRVKFKFNIPDEDFLVILTKKKLGSPIEESKSWFSYFSENIIVIRDNELDFFSKRYWPYIYAHQVAENVFQLLSGLSIKDAATFTHFTPRGCLNDLCSQHPQIEFKLRMAHICTECLSKAYLNKINSHFLRQIKDTIDAVRIKLDNFKENFSIDELSPVVVNNKGEILIGDVEIQLKGLTKALYMLFLKNPGIAFANHELKSHKDELKSIYSKIKGGDSNRPLYNLLGLDERGEKTIGQVNTEAFKNHRYFISKELKSKLGAAKYEFYQIKSSRNKAENKPQFYNQIGIPQQLIRIQ